MPKVGDLERPSDPHPIQAHPNQPQADPEYQQGRECWRRPLLDDWNAGHATAFTGRTLSAKSAHGRACVLLV